MGRGSSAGEGGEAQRRWRVNNLGLYSESDHTGDDAAELQHGGDLLLRDAVAAQ